VDLAVLIVLGIGVAIALVLALDWERKGLATAPTRDARRVHRA
jgi:hypothetical protein